MTKFFLSKIFNLDFLDLNFLDQIFLGSDVTLHPVGVFLIVWCRTMHVGAGLMVPINFWRNSDPLKKKENFSSSKIYWVKEHFSVKFSIENLSNTDQKCLKQSIGNQECFFTIKRSNFEGIFEFSIFFPSVSRPYAPEPSVGGGEVQIISRIFRGSQNRS